MKKIFSGDFRISQYFNDPCCRLNYTRFGLNGHNGLDFATPSGTDCFSPMAGMATEVRNDPSGYGFYIKIENEREGCLFGHLQFQAVTEGNAVSVGSFIGKTGNTGNSTGPHCHFGYFTRPRDRSNGFAGYVDPLPFLNQDAAITETGTIEMVPVDSLPGRCRAIGLDPDLKVRYFSNIVEFNPNGIWTYEDLCQFTLSWIQRATSAEADRVRLQVQVSGLQQQLSSLLSSSSPPTSDWQRQIDDLKTQLSQAQAHLLDLNRIKNELEAKLQSQVTSYSALDLIKLGLTKLFGKG